MKTKIQLEQSIIKITTTIKEYPELSNLLLKCPEQSEVRKYQKPWEYYNSLEDLLKKICKNAMKQRSKKLLKPEYADLQIYPPSEDIYQQLKKEGFEPRRYYKNKAPNEGRNLERKDFTDVKQVLI
jgi:hypothetical protein